MNLLSAIISLIQSFARVTYSFFLSKRLCTSSNTQFKTNQTKPQITNKYETKKKHSNGAPPPQRLVENLESVEMRLNVMGTRASFLLRNVEGENFIVSVKS